jgi:hypothetical protein
MNDIIGQADSIEEGIKFAEKKQYDYIQIVDKDTWKIVWEN